MGNTPIMTYEETLSAVEHMINDLPTPEMRNAAHAAAIYLQEVNPTEVARVERVARDDRRHHHG